MKDFLTKFGCFAGIALYIVAAIGVTVVAFQYNALYGIASIAVDLFALPTAIKLVKKLIA